jgi:hypothetical protein
MLLEQAAEEAVATDLADVESHASAPAAAAAVSLALWAHADYGSVMAQRWTLGPIGSEGQIRILDCVFGIPFQQIIPDPAWRTSTVVALAQQMYDSRDFSAMPILGDALQDAACDHADILDHCRSAGPHVRGCWVVDLVRGKE